MKRSRFPAEPKSGADRFAQVSEQLLAEEHDDG